jgi:small-conductance mechanosensitive channel
MASETRRAIRWGDLISPREVAEFTIGDAWGSLPTLFAMAGVFLGCVLLIYLIKKLLEYIFLPKERWKKYVLEETKEKNAQGRVIKQWRKMDSSRYGSIWHLVLETLFAFGLVISALFAAAIGNVNIWQSAIASIGVGAIATYVLGNGLQQLGSGFFMFLNNAISVGEYWVLVGQQIEGRVTRITPFFIEMMALDSGGHGCMHRVSMSTALNSNWQRNFYREAHEPTIVMDKVVVTEPATQMGSRLLGDEEEDPELYEDYGSEEEDHKKWK